MYLLILFGGSETTTNLLGNGFLDLQRHRDQWDLLRDDPSLVAGAMDELMRYDSPHHYLPRVVDQDFDLHGTTLRAGQTAIIVMGAANRDETKFPDPGRLDVRRDARRHMAFGFGIHQCLGQPLARIELQVVYGTLFRRVPGLRAAAGLDEIPFKNDGIVYGVPELPVSW
jgi:cytochrome P450